MKVAWSVTQKDKFLTYSNNNINLYQTRPTDGSEISKGKHINSAIGKYVFFLKQYP